MGDNIVVEWAKMQSLAPMLFGSEAIGALCGISQKNLSFRPCFGSHIMGYMNKSVALPGKRIDIGEDSYLIFEKKDIEKFLKKFYYVRNNLLTKNTRITEAVQILNNVLGIRICLKRSTIVSSYGKGLGKLLRGYDITDIMNNTEPLITAIEKSFYKKKTVKKAVFKEFEDKMAKLNICRKD